MRARCARKDARPWRNASCARACRRAFPAFGYGNETRARCEHERHRSPRDALPPRKKTPWTCARRYARLRPWRQSSDGKTRCACYGHRCVHPKMRLRAHGRHEPHTLNHGLRAKMKLRNDQGILLLHENHENAGQKPSRRQKTRCWQCWTPSVGPLAYGVFK